MRGGSDLNGPVPGGRPPESKEVLGRLLDLYLTSFAVTYYETQAVDPELPCRICAQPKSPRTSALELSACSTSTGS
ncbi:hypothetical protein M0R45_006301 [Rubus argutus]|uniref:Uncharacterized protein n=1 Tax=Rubus argutus TaxID=59490 RepID=A0AAW1YPZ5_RUBAR